MLKITALPALKDNYIWMIHKNPQEVIAVDPGDSQVVFEWLKSQSLTLTEILVTHRHKDHTGGVEALKSHYCVPVFGPDSERVPCVTHPVYENNDLALIPNYSIKVIETPGHTLDHIVFYITPIDTEYSSSGQLFCGDTLFSAGCGRIFDGTAEQLFKSLQKIKALPEDTLVYCTHEYTKANVKFALNVEPKNMALQHFSRDIDNLSMTLPTTLAQEFAVNPFLRTQKVSVKAAVDRYKERQLSTESETFVALRVWKDQH